MSAKKIISLLFILLPLFSFAQSDTIIHLRTVQINSVRNENNPCGLKSVPRDSLQRMIYIDKSLGEYLDDNSPALIKNYGPGALSSVSLRGGSAYHTAVLWKGFPIANPMNGVTDFNLLPSFLFDDMSVLYGGTSSLWGSGAVSGAVLLNNNNSFVTNNSIKIGSRYSNATGWSNFIDGKFSLQHFSSSTKIYFTNEKNAFPFHQDDELKKQVHAESKGRGLISENTWMINNQTSVNFNFWYQFADRNIAPVMTESISDAVQRDKIFRYNITFTKAGKKGRFAFRNAYFNESLHYNDSSLSQPSNSLCKTFISEPEYSFAFNDHHSIQTGVNFTAINSISTEFSNEEELLRQSIYFAYKFHLENLNLSASARKEFNKHEKPPVAISIGADYQLTKWMKVLASYSTVYRNPQMNDLFWQPGGNIDLLPESGTSYEGTIDLEILKLSAKNKNENNALSLQLTAYNKNIDNWIAWTPHGILWTPSNIKSVHSYGGESALNLKWHFRKIDFRISAFYGYTVSETTSSEFAYDASVGKQLIYVPYHKAGGNLSLIHKNSVLTLSHTYTGIRYITTDNSDQLDAYGKTNIQFDRLFKLKNYALAVFIRAENLFNTDYQAVQNRPEPLRNFGFGINLKIDQIKKNKS